MNYVKSYIKIIRLARKREICPENYCEKHHIIPKSITENNVTVSLTSREHYVCHKLIYKHCEKNYGRGSIRTRKALTAFFFMTNRLSIKKSYDYANLREEYVNSIKTRRRIEHEFFNVNGQKFVGTIAELCQTYKLNSSLIYMVIAGERRHHKGWSVSENLPPIPSRAKVITLIHENYGEFTGSISDFIKKFPNQRLSSSNLRAVKNGHRLSHKGWKNQRCITKSNCHKWQHNDYGKFECSITELTILFADKKLNRGHLSRVANGKLKQHKGWKIYE
jgi:hypothetical protein